MLSVITRRVLRQFAAPAVCAVVKADAYRHGALGVGLAALEGGADRLAVVLVKEGIELRRAGIDAPVLLLPEPGPEATVEALVHPLTPHRLYLGGSPGRARRRELDGQRGNPHPREGAHGHASAPSVVLGA
jgi:hypothetical protein